MLTEIREKTSWWTLPVVAVAQLMVVLDATIVNIALPSAQRELGMADADRHWVITAYALAFGGLLLPGGRVCGVLGHRRAFVVGLAGFALASGIGGAATDAGVLIGARGAQGVFAALLAPAALTLLTLTYTEPRERGRAFGTFAGVGAGGAALGVVAGGLLTQYVDWRWCLYINVPMAVLALIGTPVIVRDRPTGRLRDLDVAGVLLSAAGFAVLVYGFTRAEARGWSDPVVLVLLGGGVALLAVFALAQRRVRIPLLPPRVLAHRTRATALISVALMFLAMFGFYLFVSYYTQTVLGYSAVRAGLTLLVNAVAAIAGSMLLARIRVHPAVLVIGSLLLAAAGMAVLSGLGVPRLLLAQVLTGLGLGCLLATAANLVTADVGGAGDAGVASAAYNAVQQLGAALGTALLNSIALGVTALRLNETDLAQATVDGFTVALWVACGVLVAAAGIAAALTTTLRRNR